MKLFEPLFFFPDKRADRVKKHMSDIVVEVSKKPIPSHSRALVFEICANDENGEDVEVKKLLGSIYGGN